MNDLTQRSAYTRARGRQLPALLTLMIACVFTAPPSSAQPAADATKLFYALRDRMTTVKDYVADVRMKIDVAFMRVPLLAGKLYYKAPG